MVTGNLATVAFSAGITFTGGLYRRIEFEGESVEPLDDSILANTTYMTKVPGDLKEPPIATLTHFTIPGTVPPIARGVLNIGTLTITYRLLTGQSTPASITGTGFITSGPPGQIANNELQENTITFQFNGKTGPTYTPAS